MKIILITMRILIVGAGIGGLTLAALLKSNNNFSVEVIEKSKGFSNIGFSIGIWANGRNILRELGIEKGLTKKGSITERYQLLNRKGSVIVDYNLKKHFAENWPAEIQVKRDDLHNALLDKVGKEKIRLNTTIKSIEQGKDYAKVVFSDGSSEEYDLIVGADGLHSTTRKFIYDNDNEDLGLKGYWMWIPTPKKFPKSCVVEISAPNEFFGIYPHGGEKTCAYFITSNVYHTKCELGTKDLKNLFPTIFQILPELNVIKNNKATFIEFPSRVNIPKWHKERIVLLGDAAHGFENFAGIGGTMAMEDAQVLVQELCKKQKLSSSMESYEKRRIPRVELAKRSASRLRRWKITKSSFLMKLRELVLPLIPLSHFTKEYQYLMSKKL
ncbi:MAG: 2-polyprenyl-6-methoxyphenol hydroxylase-like FAD-dependent oxidoreductase [Candidatus Woesearchaeota archaeon]